ncbi:putative leader peptide [Streptomyces sp. NPDC005921]
MTSFRGTPVSPAPLTSRRYIDLARVASCCCR